MRGFPSLNLHDKQESKGSKALQIQMTYIPVKIKMFFVEGGGALEGGGGVRFCFVLEFAAPLNRM